MNFNGRGVTIATMGNTSTGRDYTHEEPPPPAGSGVEGLMILIGIIMVVVAGLTVVLAEFQGVVAVIANTFNR